MNRHSDRRHLYADGFVAGAGAGSAGAVPVVRPSDGLLEIAFECDAGLHQLSVLADARDFNWDALYFDLHKFHNTGQRTGPWDFDLNNDHRPLVPSYWMELDGARLGLWYFQRISLDDLANKRFRGRAAFHIRRAGRHVLRLKPYREFVIEWISARLEPDPEDVLVDPPANLKAAADGSPWRAWAHPEFWDMLGERLQRSACSYRDPIRHAFDWVLKEEQNSAADIPLLLAAQHLGGARDARFRILNAIDRAIGLPAWGNPREDGYGHNGDMGAALMMLRLAQALHMLGEEMGAERRKAVLAKLRVQGDAFVVQALLTRDYWGGSLLQDHGWKSAFHFAAAALNLYGLIPAADEWLRWALPRVRRSLAAMPRDGYLPASSYHRLYLYLDPVMVFRDALLAATGEDILDQPQFHPIVAFVRSLLKTPENVLRIFNDDLLTGAPGFFLAMAAKHDDPEALRIHDRMIGACNDSFYHATQQRGFYEQFLWGLVACPDRVAAAAPPSAVARSTLLFCRDSGFVHYRNDATGVACSIQVGPWCGRHAYREARGPCDRMTGSVVPVAFTLFLGTAPMLVMPESGYRLKAFLCPCMLVDDQGPYGDIGYPMSIPSWRERGEEIETVQWDGVTGRGRVRVEQAPAYAHRGVSVYTREFLFAPEQRLVCRDVVALDKPRNLAWLFHARRATGIRLDARQTALFGEPALLAMAARSPTIPLNASIQPTDVVWSYASVDHFAGYDHVRFETPEPVRALSVDFVIEWT